MIMTAESQRTLAGPLLAQLTGGFSGEELDRVRDAYEFAERLHEGQYDDQVITLKLLDRLHNMRTIEHDRGRLACPPARLARPASGGLMLRRPQWDNLHAGIAHRVTASRLTQSGRKALHWVLGSETRTWALLAPLTAWRVMQAAQGNAGSAIAIVITLPPVLAAGVKWLRDRLGISHRHHHRHHDKSH